MAVASVTKITAASSEGFDAAVREGLARANKISCGIVFPTSGSADRQPDGSVRQGGSSPGTAAARRAL